MNPFFMVYVENGGAPTFKHQNLESAEIEAKRLAKLLDKPVFVLCSIKSIELNMFKENDLRPDDNLPF